MAKEDRDIVEAVLSEETTDRIWTAKYPPVLPYQPSDFVVGALLPAILYMLRRGHRRGSGGFAKTFSGGTGKTPTIQTVAQHLAKSDGFDGFHLAAEESILGDLLLTFALENKGTAEGHDKQVQRCFASHYMSSWLDLPSNIADLRGVPESIVAMMAAPATGDDVVAHAGHGQSPIGMRIDDNTFLRAFAAGVRNTGANLNGLPSDVFDETERIGIDQLLMVRLAQLCKFPPVRASGKRECESGVTPSEPWAIPTQLPIASRAAAVFRDDILTFVECYSDSSGVSHLALMTMLETALALGLVSVLLATVGIVEHWVRHGAIPSSEQQVPWPLFVDASGSSDARIRDASELSFDHARRQLARLGIPLMYMRLLGNFVRIESDLTVAERPPSAPVGDQWLNLLGAIATGAHPEAREAERSFRRMCRSLADALEKENPEDPRVVSLRDEDGGMRHGLRLAETLEPMLHHPSAKVLMSSLMADKPNGLAKRRKDPVSGASTIGPRYSGEATSIVLSNTALDYLVHRHLRGGGNGGKQSLSYPGFLKILRERYGLFIDRSPPNMNVSSELLLRNRRVLERRLRELGVLVGVNDAETMKKFRARYASHRDELAAESESV